MLIGIPNILNLYLNEIICSFASLNTTNPDPKVEDSTVACVYEYPWYFIHCKRLWTLQI